MRSPATPLRLGAWHQRFFSRLTSATQRDCYSGLQRERASGTRCTAELSLAPGGAAESAETFSHDRRHCIPGGTKAGCSWIFEATKATELAVDQTLRHPSGFRYGQLMIADAGSFNSRRGQPSEYESVPEVIATRVLRS